MVEVEGPQKRKNFVDGVSIRLSTGDHSLLYDSW